MSSKAGWLARAVPTWANETNSELALGGFCLSFTPGTTIQEWKRM